MYNSEEISIKHDLIPNYKRRMLLEMDQKIYIPMSFILGENEDKVLYNYSGFQPFERVLEEFNMTSFFNYIEKLFKNFIISEAYLLSPEEIELNISNLYVETESKTPRIKYLPKEIFCNNEYEQYKKLLTEIIGLDISHDAKKYIKGIIRYIDSKKTLPEIITYIYNIKREIMYC